MRSCLMMSRQEENPDNKGYDIVFDHVAFSYKAGEQVLSDVSFTAKQGEVTALIGPSGGVRQRFPDWQQDSGITMPVRSRSAE